MPKTPFQDLIFSLMMVTITVYVMTIYNTALLTGLHADTFYHAFVHMWPEAIAAFFAQRWIAGPFAMKKVKHYQNHGVPQILIPFLIPCFTAFLMAPLMTFYVTLLHAGLNKDFFVLWLPRLVLNFPFALFIQLFCLGPFMRLIFPFFIKIISWGTVKKAKVA